MNCLKGNWHEIILNLDFFLSVIPFEVPYSGSKLVDPIKREFSELKFIHQELPGVFKGTSFG